MKVIITGAAGNLGGKLAGHLAQAGRYDLSLIDLRNGGNADIVEADMAQNDPAWMDLLVADSVVVHLAANPDPTAGWPDLIAPNVDAVLNLYAAAARKGVRRVILASSVWALRRHDDRPGMRTGAMPPDPGENAYGASKLFAERIAHSYAATSGMETVVVRLGTCLPADDSEARMHLAGGWTQECWLSHRDFCRGMEAAILCEMTGFATINLTSRIEGGRWSLDDLERLTGAVPIDRYSPRLGLKQRTKTGAARMIWKAIPRLSRLLIRRDW